MRDDNAPERVARAAEFADWQQVALNGGPPCFRVEADGHFCFRAERWDGHRPGGIHGFVSLGALLSSPDVPPNLPDAEGGPKGGDGV